MCRSLQLGCTFDAFWGRATRPTHLHFVVSPRTTCNNNQRECTSPYIMHYCDNATRPVSHLPLQVDVLSGVWAWRSQYSSAVRLVEGRVYFLTTRLRPSFILKVKIIWGFVINCLVTFGQTATQSQLGLISREKVLPRPTRNPSACSCLARVALEVSLRYIIHL